MTRALAALAVLAFLAACAGPEASRRDRVAAGIARASVGGALAVSGAAGVIGAGVSGALVLTSPPAARPALIDQQAVPLLVGAGASGIVLGVGVALLISGGDEAANAAVPSED